MAAEHLEVWGDPIGHSRSPQLHLAAYRALGLDWEFTRREVPADAFAVRLAASGARGLAVTYPLKERAFAAAAWRDERAELTGVANTLFRGDPAGIRAYNTDVGGLAIALREAGAGDAAAVRILGAGATATSALVAAAENGASRVAVAARRPERAAHLVALGERVGAAVSVERIGEPASDVDLTIATLPGGSALGAPDASALSRRGGTLFDVAYSPWPSQLAEAWDGSVHHGLGMLLHQAALQVRVFVGGDVSRPLAGEEAVVGAMRAALMGD
ncbi:shikimate dehydrogenase [Microbacterium indicum]|uniref:shikimate dehydrogenase n=1 Tax=Microbacterium indicum TaxID=358100 RepID=UPI0003FBF69A|nr:shikimate dehydrogenase [Microbacterium indicum]